MDSLPKVWPSLLARRPIEVQRRLAEAFTDAWETGVLAPERVRTGCVYEPQPINTYCFAVMRYDPRISGRRQIPFHEWWPEMAPSAPLLEAYRHMDSQGRRRIYWKAFASQYLAELDRLPALPILGFLDTLNTMSSRYTTITLLCCEHAPRGNEQLVRCHRRLLRAWLLGEEVADIAEVADGEICEDGKGC